MQKFSRASEILRFCVPGYFFLNHLVYTYALCCGNNAWIHESGCIIDWKKCLAWSVWWVYIGDRPKPARIWRSCMAYTPPPVHSKIIRMDRSPFWIDWICKKSSLVRLCHTHEQVSTFANPSHTFHRKRKSLQAMIENDRRRRGGLKWQCSANCHFFQLVKLWLKLVNKK